MKIERYQPGRRQTPPELIACGCTGMIVAGMSLMVIIAFFLIPGLPGIILSFFGIEDMGNTDAILNASAGTIPALMDTQTIGSVTLNTGNYAQTLNSTGAGYSVVMGDTEDMMQLQMQLSFTEEGLLEQCRELTALCSRDGEGLRNATFDLRPGGIIVEGEFELSNGIWQDASLVIQFGNNNRIEFTGVDIRGRVYAPGNTDLANLVNEAETRVNLFVEQLSARTGINEFRLSTIITDDTTLTLIME